MESPISRPTQGQQIKDIKFTISRKEYSDAIVLIRRLIKEYPELIEYKARLLKLEMFTSNLPDLQKKIKVLMQEADQHPAYTANTSKFLLGAIQYAFQGKAKMEMLLELLRLTRGHYEKSKKNAKSLATAQILLALQDHEAFTKEVSNLPLDLSMKPLGKELVRIAQILQNSDFRDFQAPKIFGIGLSRTGTKSLTQALITLGYHSIHWINNLTLDIITPTDFFLFDALTDISVSYQFEYLYYLFPNAQFIYTTRSLEPWQRSISTHYQNARGIAEPSGLNHPEAKNRFSGLPGIIEGSLYGHHSSWEAAYRSYDKRVRTFFSDKPSKSFLEIDIVGGENWEKLCSFLSRPIPAEPFPHQNLGNYKNTFE